MSADLLQDFNNITIQIKDDPRIVNLQDIFRCVVYTFTTTMKIWIRLAKARQESTDVTNVYNKPNITAGYLYNHIIVSGQHNNATPSEIELSDIEFEHVCSMFMQVAKAQPKLSIIVKSIDDIYDGSWELLYHFIIPIRLISSTIPRDVRIISLRKWFNTVLALPFINKYTQQYISVIPNVQRLSDFYKQFLSDYNNSECKLITNFAKISYNDISNIFISTIACRNNTQNFIRLCAAMFIISSIDIIKHYCPNYIACANVNNDFDGAWVNMFDPYHMEHIKKVNDLLMFTKTSTI